MCIKWALVVTWASDITMVLGFVRTTEALMSSATVQTAPLNGLRWVIPATHISMAPQGSNTQECHQIIMDVGITVASGSSMDHSGPSRRSIPGSEPFLISGLRHYLFSFAITCSPKSTGQVYLGHIYQCPVPGNEIQVFSNIIFSFIIFKLASLLWSFYTWTTKVINQHSFQKNWWKHQKDMFWNWGESLRVKISRKFARVTPAHPKEF